MLDVNLLKNDLNNLPIASNEDQVKISIADCWERYFLGATLMGVSPVPGSLNVCKMAMIDALSGINSDGPNAFQKGISAFWGVLIENASSVWIVAPNVITTVTIPINLPFVEISLKGIVLTNISGKNVVEDISNALHDNGGVGGNATITTQSGTTTIIPIL